MSKENTTCCAACGIAEIDDIKLVPCDCDLVRYCGDECRHIHKSEHEEDCKMRAAELRDELLFKQPDSNHMGDCPICCLPLPLDDDKSCMMGCCSKVICDGCLRANKNRETELRLEQSCPFCREPLPSSKKEHDKQRVKRAKANDPLAMCQEGVQLVSKGDYRSALAYYTKAVALGDVGAHYKLAGLYFCGYGVEKDELKYIHHWEEAAIGGHSGARYCLGAHEWETGKKERAVKHWIIAATQGEDEAIKALMHGAFKEGFVKKDVLATALRAHKAAVDATKSPQREAAEQYNRMNSLFRNGAS